MQRGVAGYHANDMQSDLPTYHACTMQTENQSQKQFLLTIYFEIMHGNLPCMTNMQLVFFFSSTTVRDLEPRCQVLEGTRVFLTFCTRGTGEWVLEVFEQNHKVPTLLLTRFAREARKKIFSTRGYYSSTKK